MAQTQAELDEVFVEIGTLFKGVDGRAGDLSSLSTTAKSTLVAAINEVKNQVGAAGAQIIDTSPSTTTVYSSSKTDLQISDARAALKDEILGGASAAFDTLQELVDYFNNLDAENDADVASLFTAVGNRVRFDDAQTLTASEKIQANANIGSVSLADFGDPAHSYKDVLIAAMA